MQSQGRVTNQNVSYLRERFQALQQEAGVIYTAKLQGGRQANIGHNAKSNSWSLYIMGYIGTPWNDRSVLPYKKFQSLPISAIKS
ncbi:hypothetical protein EYC80_005285 [Monilinia laxa]|uniref:Uncharacterized protein n=1 Tax=Monilinia laxa TaxID=61186 RepID=A0A5N6KJF8_MONLA|nr:hypothetical protein EYC80_005285 [Monilinia laxa]